MDEYFKKQKKIGERTTYESAISKAINILDDKLNLTTIEGTINMIDGSLKVVYKVIKTVKFVDLMGGAIQSSLEPVLKTEQEFGLCFSEG